MNADASAACDDAGSSSWMNVVLKPGDEEIEQIQELERQAKPMPPAANAIRELITRFEICHFKIERHLQRIVEAIASLRLDFVPASIGKAHPRFGETAWLQDRTGRSRRGQEIIWVLEMWLADAPYADQDPRRIPRALFDELTGALGKRTAPKTTLVSALVARLLLKENRPTLPAELAAFWEPIERTDICHYAFPANARRIIEAIGRLEPPQDFEGCGSCGARQRELAEEYFRGLCTWLQGGRGNLTAALGDRTPVKAWLVACLAKTLKEHAELPGSIPLPV